MIFLLPAFFSACAKESYPESKLRESLIEMCRKEYGISDVRVKIAGTTLGVFLPLKNFLVHGDLKSLLTTGKVKDLDSLLEPSPEAVEKMMDVHFSISRVALSTDKALDFYVLQSTDVEKTGVQHTIIGYVNDIKRYKISDISRSEYSKRLVHERTINSAVLLDQPVKQFFDDLEKLSIAELKKQYFGENLMPELETFFDKTFSGPNGQWPKTHWSILDLRSSPPRQGVNDLMVYAQVQPADWLGKQVPQDTKFAFVFLLGARRDGIHIVRIIPYQLLREDGTIEQIPFPPEFDVKTNMEGWQEEFPLNEIQLGDFLAEQITRRVKAIVRSDERIQNTFLGTELEFKYHESPLEKAYFSLDMDVAFKEFNHYAEGSIVKHEDMVYLLNLISREFVNVLRGYQFGEYQYLSLQVAQEPNAWIFLRDDLELFRRNKIAFTGLLSAPANI